MRATTIIVFAGAFAGLAGCRLGPLVDDVPTASANVLPAGSVVPSVTTNANLLTQIQINDGLDDDALAASGNVVTRGTGESNGAPVRFWAFGTATRAPSPLYQFYSMQNGAMVQLPHPPMVDALPGDPGYGPMHTLVQVVVTPAYHGEIFPDTEALSDALDLGLIEPPVVTNTFVSSPIVTPDTLLEVGGGMPPAAPTTVYAHGYAVGAFFFGGNLGVQPYGSLIPARQVSFLRRPTQGIFDATNPIFQLTIPTVPATTMPSYTPLSVVVDVNLTGNQTITSDSDLFVRSTTTPIGQIVSTSDAVADFQITTTILVLQLQFMEGKP